MPPRDVQPERGVGNRIMSPKTNGGATTTANNNNNQHHPVEPHNNHGQHHHNRTNGNIHEQEDGEEEEIEQPCFFFLSKQAAAELPRYQYQGQDLSLLYKYVLSPLASFCVEHWTPLWLAPNSITLIGLLFMVAAYLAMWWYAPALQIQQDDDDAAAPRWIFLLNGIAMLIYQTLDNMDGKQARRTGNGSPLGLLFDHGCDAVNNVFGSANWIISMALHPVHDVYLCFSILFGPYVLFFFSTWEEYYTGKLIMPIVNGPNEGLLGGALMSFCSWWLGPQIWKETQAWDTVLYPVLSTVVPHEWLPSIGLRNTDILVLIATHTFVMEPLGKAVFVVRRYGTATLINILPFMVFLVCPVLIGWIDLQVWLDMPRTSLHLCAALFVEMTVDLMMCHMTKQQYSALRWPLVPLVILTILVGTGVWSAGRQTADFLLIYTTMIVTYLLFKTAVTIHEICCVLNIFCFDITTKRPSRRKGKQE